MTRRMLAIALVLASLGGCQDRPGHQPAPATTATTNPVQNEMRLLTSALEATVGAIGRGDVRSVEHEIHRVHLAKEATDEAIRTGSYRLPRNPDGLADFRALDAEFHGELERLIEASRRNDVDSTAQAFGSVVQRCDGCHRRFRR